MGAWPGVRRGAAVLLGFGFLVAFTMLVLQSQKVFLQILPGLAWPAVLGAIAFVVAGLVVMWDLAQWMNGVLLVAFGLCYWLYYLAAEFERTWVAVVILLSSNVMWVLLVLVLLRRCAPERRLARWYERAFVVGSAAWLGTWQVVDTITATPTFATPDQAAQWPSWVPDQDIHEIASRALYLGNAALGSVAGLLIVLRIIRTRGLDRRTYGPLYVAAAAAGVATLVNFFAVDAHPATSAASRTLTLVEMYTLLLVALALLFGPLQRMLARLRIADLVLHVNAARTPESVQAALRRTMADPSLTLQFWSPDINGYVDVEGRPTEQLGAGPWAGPGGARS